MWRSFPPQQVNRSEQSLMSEYTHCVCGAVSPPDTIRLMCGQITGDLHLSGNQGVDVWLSVHFIRPALVLCYCPFPFYSCITSRKPQYFKAALLCFVYHVCTQLLHITHHRHMNITSWIEIWCDMKNIFIMHLNIWIWEHSQQCLHILKGHITGQCFNSTFTHKYPATHTYTQILL